MHQSDILKVKLAEAETSLSRMQGAPLNENTVKKKESTERDIKNLKDRIKVAEKEEAAENEKLKTGTPVHPEDIEIAAMRDQVSVGKMLQACISGSRFTGVEEDFRQATKTNEREISLDAFSPKVANVVEKVDVVTGVPSVTGINFGSIVPAVFAESEAPGLQISMPRVPSGQYSIPRLTANLTAGAKVKGAAQESTAAAFTVESAKPRRISARLTLRIEDLAEVGIAGFEAALRANLQEVLSDVLNGQLLTGDGSSPNISGLMNQLTEADDPTDVVTFKSFAEAMANGIDGKWAARLSDVKALVNAVVYRSLSTTYQTPVFIDKGAGGTANQSGVGSRSILSVADWAAANTGGVRCSSRMPDSVSNIGKGILVRSGSRTIPADAASMPAILPIWGNISISDIFTDSAKGLQHLSLHVLVGDKVLVRQPAVYQEFRIKTA